MNLTGTWKPYGRYARKEQMITIQDQELTLWIGVISQNPRQTTVHFHLEEESCLRANNCHAIKIDEEGFRNYDFMVHEEEIEGRTVVILSNMTMEYDGRGRIVIGSYIREEDYELVNDEFESLAYQYCNKRSSIPTMRMNDDGSPMSFMGVSMMGGMGMNMMSNLAGPSSAAQPSALPPVEPWDCTCGKKQNTGRFCSECGMPMPSRLE